ncbi:MAG: nuclear transport factor 2 family protein [Burkholderiaceae bacterium]|jgi:ketosteroid isomerase-like protein
MEPLRVVLDFLDCINGRNADALAERMTDDHVFIDSLGHSVHGKEAMREAWRSYFAFCPNYWVTQHTVLAHGQSVAVFGEAGGTIAQGSDLPAANQWRTPAAWLAEVQRGLIQQWRVYADNKPVYDILSRSKRPDLA